MEQFTHSFNINLIKIYELEQSVYTDNFIANCQYVLSILHWSVKTCFYFYRNMKQLESIIVHNKKNMKHTKI